MKRFTSSAIDWIGDVDIRKQINVFKRFLLFVTCVNTALLAQCTESEKKKYVALGGAMLISTLLAFVSGTIAIEYVFPELVEYGFLTAISKQVIAILLSLFWTMIIFNLQRFIISGSSRISESDRAGVDELLKALPALVVSITVGVAIALPIEIFLFKPEIELHMSYTREQNRLDREEKMESSAYRSMHLKCTEHYRIAIASGQPINSCLGQTNAGTKDDSVNDNNTSKPLDTNVTNAESVVVSIDEDSDYLKKQSVILSQLKQELGSLEERKHRENQLVDRGGGLVSRISALFEASPFFAYSVLLFILFIQLTPVLIKIMAPKSTYEYMVEMLDRVVLAYGGISPEPDRVNGGIEPKALAVYDEEGLGKSVAIYHRAEEVATEMKMRFIQEKEAQRQERLEVARVKMRRIERFTKSNHSS